MPPAMRNAADADAHHFEERRRRPGKEEQHDAGDDDRLQCHAAAELFVGALRHRGEERHQRDRLDHDEEQHEELEELVDHLPP